MRRAWLWLKAWHYRRPSCPRTLGSMTDYERGVLYERMGSPRNVDPTA